METQENSVELVPARRSPLAKSFRDSTMRDIFRPGPEAFTANGKLRASWKAWVMKQVEVAFARIELEAQRSRPVAMADRTQRLI